MIVAEGMYVTSTVSGGSIHRSRRQETILSHKRVSERLPTASPHFLLVLVNQQELLVPCLFFALDPQHLHLCGPRLRLNESRCLARVQNVFFRLGVGQLGPHLP
jgi:hypothetical protein